MAGLYGEDLAAAHEAGFTALAEAAARHVMDLRPPGQLLDLGCGGGSLSAALADAGFQVRGLDASPAMVALARRRTIGDFRVGDVATAALPGADVIAAAGEILGYALDTPDALGRFFCRVHAALPPDGLFLFDLATPGRAPETTVARRSGRDWRVEAAAREDGDRLVRTIDTWRTVDGRERHTREVHRLQLFDPDDVLTRLREAGFRAERLGGYDDFPFQTGWDGFEAVR